MSTPLLKVDRLGIAHGSRTLLSDVSFEVALGQPTCLLGRSGFGKTSLLRALAELHPTVGGQIHWAEKRKSGRKTAVVFQDSGLFPWKTVAENLDLAVRYRSSLESKGQVTIRIERLVREMGLGHRMTAYPGQLSGGEKQRVGLARALALRPSLLLLDEPFSAVDALTRSQLQELLLEIHHNFQVDYLMVTHSVDEALYLGRQILVLGPSEQGFGTVAVKIENPYFGCQEPFVKSEAVTLRRKILHELSHDGQGLC